MSVAPSWSIPCRDRPQKSEDPDRLGSDITITPVHCCEILYIMGCTYVAAWNLYMELQDQFANQAGQPFHLLVRLLMQTAGV